MARLLQEGGERERERDHYLLMMLYASCPSSIICVAFIHSPITTYLRLLFHFPAPPIQRIQLSFTHSTIRGVIAGFTADPSNSSALFYRGIPGEIYTSDSQNCLRLKASPSFSNSKCVRATWEWAWGELPGVSDILLYKLMSY